MTRHYLIKGWHNASEYSGEQIGNRLKRSVNIYNPDGTANLKAFPDDDGKPKKQSVADKVLNCPYDKLDQQENAVMNEYLDGIINEDKLSAALYAIGMKRYHLK